MIKVIVSKQSNYPVSSVAVRKRLVNFLKAWGIVSDTVVHVAIVGEKKMLILAKKYLHEVNVVHNVLSFPSAEATGEFVYPPDDTIHLGEIVLCYPKLFEEAKTEGTRLEEKVFELIEHGALHLLGIHHD